MAGMDLMRLFNQLLLASGGDVEEAMEWMRYLQEQGHIDDGVDLDAFFDELEENRLVERASDGSLSLSSTGERRIRRSAFEEIFSNLKKGGIAVNEADKDAFIEASKPIYDEFASSVSGGADLIKQVQALAN